MVDIRGNKLSDGDLALKIVDGRNTSNKLVYCIIINGRTFYKNPFITFYAKTQNNQIVKIENPTAREECIRKELLNALTELDGKTIVGVKTSEVVETANKLLKEQ